mmetsp:Transcript_3812/g.5520  ORF Transcript_3812/g.5520 Transcript_3812/m.5520 type:complete len:232 (+) Transcript_3812:100-795(+)
MNKTTILYSLVLLAPVSGLQISRQAYHRAPAPPCLQAHSRERSSYALPHYEARREIHPTHPLRASSSADDTNSPMGGLRAMLRKTTGFSLTATRAACRAATGISISSIFAKVLSIFPLFLRFFIQPLLVLYYTPLVLLKAMVGPTAEYSAEQKAKHEVFIEGWKDAIKIATEVNESGYWPVRVTEDGTIEAVSPPDLEDASTVNLNKAIVQSVSLASSAQGGDTTAATTSN